MYDLSAQIDYALEMNGQARLILVGYSMGTTEAFALLAARPEYNDKVSLLINFTPIVFWKHKLPPAMKWIVDNVEPITVKKKKIISFFIQLLFQIFY